MINNKSLSTKTILTVVILVALGTIAYFVMPKNFSPIAVQPTPSLTITPTATSTPEPTVTPILKPTITPIPTSNMDITSWKIYKNEKFRYEVKYPLTWFAYDYYYNGEKHPENLYIQNFSRPEDGGFSGIGGTGCQLSVWVESDKYASIKDWIDVQKNNLGKDLEKVATKEIELGGIKGLTVTFSGSFLGSGDPVVVILNNEILYKIVRYWQDIPQENCQPVFNKILSNFKFIK